MLKNKNPLSWYGFLKNPLSFGKRVFWTLLVQNKKHASSKNMLVILVINIIIITIELALWKMSLTGDAYAILAFGVFLSTDIFIRFFLIYIKSRSFIYAFFLSMPVLTWVIPVWNLYQNKIKPQFVLD